MAERLPSFQDKLRGILKARGIPLTEFNEDTGIDRANFFYRRETRKHCRHIYMAIAYYLDMSVEDLVAGTDAENDWYGD